MGSIADLYAALYPDPGKWILPLLEHIATAALAALITRLRALGSSRSISHRIFSKYFAQRPYNDTSVVRPGNEPK